MARHGVYVLALAAVLLLLGISTVSRSKGLKGREHQRAPQIPSQFSPGERFAMKEALKGEPGPLCPAMPRYIGPSLLGPPRAAPLPPQRGHYWNWSSTTLPRPAQPESQHLVPGHGDATLAPDLASGGSGVPCLAWNLP